MHPWVSMDGLNNYGKFEKLGPTVKDSEKQEGYGVVALERLTEPLVTIEWLLAKRNSLSNLLVFLGLYGRPEERLSALLHPRKG